MKNIIKTYQNIYKKYFFKIIKNIYRNKFIFKNII